MRETLSVNGSFCFLLFYSSALEHGVTYQKSEMLYRIKTYQDVKATHSEMQTVAYDPNSISSGCAVALNAAATQ